jgi:hypothetical protein
MSAECVICDTKIGDNIGGHFVGMHHRNPVIICDWCKMCMEELSCPTC